MLAASVMEFTPTASGFVVQLSEEIDSSKLNLFDTESGAMGEADVSLTGAATGDVLGSLVVQGTTLVFVASGGPLAADTYAVTLRSAADGFTSLADGTLLDGETNGSLPSGDGAPGGDFMFEFTVDPGPELVVSLPDIARGPAQAIQSPAGGSEPGLTEGLPVRLSNAAGVSSLLLTVNYDPSLMDVTDVQLGADAPAGSFVESNLSVPGVAIIAFFALDPLAAGQANIVELIASVPEDASYGRAQALRITSLDVNAGAMDARADDALHVVAFAGDVNANRRYDAEDARLIARVGVGLDSGFVSANPTSTSLTTPLFPTIDPTILGDVTGNGTISPLDASDVLRKVVGLSVPNLPDLPTSQAPFGLNLSGLAVAEGQPAGTQVGTFSTSDPTPNDTFTYSLVSGSGDESNDLFTISDGMLLTAGPLSATQDNFSIRVRTTDSTGRSFEKNFLITVAQENQAPTAISLSGSTLPEDQAVGGVVATLSTTDPNASDSFTYSLVAGQGDEDNAAFEVSGNQLLLNTAVDFETQSSHSIRLRSTDSGGESVEESFVLTVTDVNDAPTAIEVTSTDVPADAAVGTLVGAFSTVDDDSADTHTYALVSGDGDTDNGLFSVSGSELLTATTFAIATQSSYSIRVRSTDSAGESVERVVTGNVVDGNVAPTAISLSGSTLPEDQAVGGVVATLSTTDPNASDSFTYSLVAGQGDADNAAFEVSGNQLLLNTAVDFETQSSHSIRLRSTDSGGQSVEESFVLTVTDVNEAPTAIGLSDSNLLDGEPSGTTVGLLTAGDPDAGDLLTFALVAGEGDDNNASFTISGDQLVTVFQADRALQNSYSVRVRATDELGLTLEQSLTILVTEPDVSPTGVELSSTAVADASEAGTLVGTLSTDDPDATGAVIYALVAGDGDADNSAFAISGDQLFTIFDADMAVQDSYSIRIRVADARGLGSERIFAISVVEPEFAPTAIQLSSDTIAENAAIGSVVGELTAADANADDTHTYALVAGDGDIDNADFAIVDDTLVTAAELDFETQPNRSVRVRSTDSSGQSIEQVLTVSVTDSNEAPTAVTISKNLIADLQTSGAVVGLLTTEDPDALDTFTYTLVAGDGDGDNSAFELLDGKLVSASSVDAAVQDLYSVRMRSEDAGGLAIDQVLEILVSEANVAPTMISVDNDTIPRNTPAGTPVATFATADENELDAHLYSLVSGTGDTDNAMFTVVGDQLVLAADVDSTTQGSLSIRVMSEDPYGLSVEEVLVMTLADVVS